MASVTPMGTLVAPVQNGLPTAVKGSTANSAKLKKTTQQFEAMFMTEMLHFARPSSHATGPFAAGDGEKTFQVFMDQALGNAAAQGIGNDLGNAIQKSLAAAGGHANTSTHATHGAKK